MLLAWVEVRFRFRFEGGEGMEMGTGGKGVKVFACLVDLEVWKLR